MYNNHSDTQQITLWDTNQHILNKKPKVPQGVMESQCRKYDGMYELSFDCDLVPGHRMSLIRAGVFQNTPKS